MWTNILTRLDISYLSLLLTYVWKKFKFQECVHKVLKEMESEWPEDLKNIKLEKFQVDYDPCLKCMIMDYDDPVAVR